MKRRFLCIRCAVGMMDDHKVEKIEVHADALERGDCYECGRDSWCDWYIIEPMKKGEFED